jgi:hypothetical protein
MKNLYLAIDGVLLTTKHTQAAPGVDEFVDFITAYFEYYWLTTHCKGYSTPALRYLSPLSKIGYATDIIAHKSSLQTLYFLVMLSLRSSLLIQNILSRLIGGFASSA